MGSCNYRQVTFFFLIRLDGMLFLTNNHSILLISRNCLWLFVTKWNRKSQRKIPGTKRQVIGRRHHFSHCGRRSDCHYTWCGERSSQLSSNSLPNNKPLARQWKSRVPLLSGCGVKVTIPHRTISFSISEATLRNRCSVLWSLNAHSKLPETVISACKE